MYILDSTYPGLMNIFARGKVGSAQLDQPRHYVREDEKADAQDEVKRCLRIAALHHPVDSPRPRHLTMLLEDSADVKGALQDLLFGLVLCGHEHVCDASPLGKGL
jgi:hypothetical protein